MAGKKPKIVRDHIFNGLTGPCAAEWYAFLAEEYDMMNETNDLEMIRKVSLYRRKAAELSTPPIPAVYSSYELESQIARWRCVKD